MGGDCVILGTGNIGTDLLAKLERSSQLRVVGVAGIDPRSAGLERARRRAIPTGVTGASWIVDHCRPGTIVFDATSATAHAEHAPALLAAGFRLIDLTPAKLGPAVVPAVNLDAHLDAPDVNLLTCGGQATIPIVASIAGVAPVRYAEIVATISSRSAGPGTRLNIDEFTRTTASGLVELGGAKQGKAIIILNPADPPLLMRNTITCALDDEYDRDAVTAAITAMVDVVAAYVPGYRLVTDPVFVGRRVTTFVEVEGAGDHLPPYAGNLDIMTSAAVRVGEQLARLAVSA